MQLSPTLLLVERARPVAADMDAILVLLKFEERWWLLAELACYKREGAVEQRRCACAMRQARYGREACGSRCAARTSGHGVVRDTALQVVAVMRCCREGEWTCLARPGISGALRQARHHAGARMVKEGMLLAQAMHVMACTWFANEAALLEHRSYVALIGI